VSNKNHHSSGERDTQLTEQQLLDYLRGELPPDQQHAIEAVLQEDDFLNDAVEGLQEVKSKEAITQITAQLNLQLRRQIRDKKEARRVKRRFKPDSQTWVYIIILLLLVVLAFAVIKNIR